MLDRIYRVAGRLGSGTEFEQYFAELQSKSPTSAPSFDEARKDYAHLVHAQVWLY